MLFPVKNTVIIQCIFTDGLVTGVASVASVQSSDKTLSESLLLGNEWLNV